MNEVMNDKVRKQLGGPKNDLERDTLNYIEPLITEMIGEDIIGKKLTLSGCLEHCFKKGKKFEVKSGKGGFAKISEEQHFAWVREYFGIEEDPAGAAVPGSEASSEGSSIAKNAEKLGTKLSFDLDSLFDD